jgi:invasion protein IalB
MSNLFYRCKFMLASAVALAHLSAHDVMAEIANGSVFDDWTVSCTAETSERTTCALTQTVVTSEEQQFLTEIGLNAVSQEGTDAIVMVMRTPSAMMLNVQPAFRIGSAEPVTLNWRTCAGDFCTAIQVLSPEDLAAMRAAASMIVGYQSVTSQTPVTFNLSLSGVTAGLSALGIP